MVSQDFTLLDISTNDTDSTHSSSPLNIKMTSDLISKEPKNLKGMMSTFKKIGDYLGSKENAFEHSVPKSVTLVPVDQVCCDEPPSYEPDIFYAAKAINILHEMDHKIKKFQKFGTSWAYRSQNLKTIV